MRRSSILAALALGAAFAAVSTPAAQAEPPVVSGARKDPRVATIRAAIERSNAVAIEALKMGDAKLYGARFVPAGELLQVSGRVIRGRADIEQWFSNQVTELGTLHEGEIVTRDVFPLGATLAYETGRHKLTFAQRGVPSATLEGRYVAVWKRGPDGRWKVLRAIEVPRD